ncbi:MAG: sigma-70 family RNA polymerase sigma factor [Planctomycetota bacterium]
MDIEELLSHRPYVRALARSLVKDDARADDLVQQTWLTAMEKPPRHSRSLRAWLGAVVRNLARTQNRSEWRRARYEKNQVPGTALPTPEATLERAAWHKRLVEAVMELDEPYRTTVLLRYFEELDSNEIAQAQGVPAATVRTRLRRGLARLREKLDRETEGGRATWVPALMLLAQPPPAPAPAPAPTSAWMVPAAALVGMLGVGVWWLVQLVENPSDENPRSATVWEAPTTPLGPNEPLTLPDPVIGHQLEVLVLEDGRPAPGAAVVVERTAVHPWRDTPAGPWSRVRREVTQGDGRAWFSGLPDGYVRVAAWKPGRARTVEYAWLPLTISYAVVVDLDEEQPLRLEVVDAERGAAIAGAWIGCSQEPAPDTFRTGPDGVATITGLALGATAQLRIAADGFTERTVRARAGRIELEPADRTVRWPILPPVPPPGPVEFRRDGVSGFGAIEGGSLVAHELPRGTWPEHEAHVAGAVVARVEAERGVEQGPAIRFEVPQLLQVSLADAGPIVGFPLRLQNRESGEPVSEVRTDGRFLRSNEEPVRLAYRERGATRWLPLRDVTTGEVTVRLPEACRIRITGAIPDRLAVYVERERYEPLRRDGSLELELRPHPGRTHARIDLLAHGFVALQRAFDLREPGAYEWAVDFTRAAPLELRVRGRVGELVLADPRSGEVRRRGPWWFRLEPGPDGIIRESMVPPGVHVVRDLVRGVTSAPFEAPARLILDLEAAVPWVKGRVVAHAGLARESTRLEAIPGGLIEVAKDGSFRFPWPGPCELHARLGDANERVLLDRPSEGVRLALTPVAALRVRAPAAVGRLIARGEDGRAIRVESRDGLRFEDLPPGRYDLWFDLPGFVPLERRGIDLVEGDNALAIECDAGATLRVTAPGRIPVTVRVQSLEEPWYVRTGHEVVAGIGPGRFRVTVWDRFTGLQLYRGEIASAGRGEIPLAFD